MEEGKLFLSVTVLYCHDYLIFFVVEERETFPQVISLIVDDRLWFHSVIQTGDLPSFLQILQIPMSSLLARDIKPRPMRDGPYFKMCK